MDFSFKYIRIECDTRIVVTGQYVSMHDAMATLDLSGFEGKVLRAFIDGHWHYDYTVTMGRIEVCSPPDFSIHQVITEGTLLSSDVPRSKNPFSGYDRVHSYRIGLWWIAVGFTWQTARVIRTIPFSPSL